jgi:hypothetical protein
MDREPVAVALTNIFWHIIETLMPIVVVVLVFYTINILFWRFRN